MKHNRAFPLARMPACHVMCMFYSAITYNCACRMTTRMPDEQISCTQRKLKGPYRIVDSLLLPVMSQSSYKNSCYNGPLHTTFLGQKMAIAVSFVPREFIRNLK